MPDKDSELEEFRRHKEMIALQDELLLWAKRRFWIIAIVSVLAGLFGLRLLIKDILTEDLEKVRFETAKAQVAADNAREAGNRARQSAEEAEGKLADLGKRIEDNESKVRLTTKQLEERASQRISENQLTVDNLQKKVSALEAAIKSLTEDRSTAGNTAEDLSNAIQSLENQANQQKEDFRKNSKYSVLIAANDTNDEIAIAIQNTLSKRGFKTSIGTYTDPEGIIKRVSINFPPGQFTVANSIRDLVVESVKGRIPARLITTFESTTEDADDFSVLLLD